MGSKFHPHFFVYDMMSGQSIKVPWKIRSQEFNSAKFEISPDGRLLAFVGRFGNIHLVSAKSKEVLKTIKMNDWCHGLAFSKDSGTLFTCGEGGEVNRKFETYKIISYCSPEII